MVIFSWEPAFCANLPHGPIPDPENRQDSRHDDRQAAAPYGQLNWKWMLGLGILFIILGTVGLGMSFALTLATAMMFGILLLVSGTFQVFDAFGRKGWKGIIWHVLIGLLYIAPGVATVTNPVATSTVLTAMLAGMFIAIELIMQGWTLVILSMAARRG